MAKEYMVCTRCIMDTAVPDIKFDEKGQCNYCAEYIEKISRMKTQESERNNLLLSLVDKIKEDGKNKDYDCILGVSGGLDSSYVLYKTKELGLRPLAVHLDNGWDSELSINNIERLVKSLKVDLYTHVINWDEFKRLQIAFFKADVVDIEMLTDHAIIAILYKTAYKRKIKYILAGTNMANEGMRMPKGWNHIKLDLKNIKAIYKRFGNYIKLETFPMMSLAENLKIRLINKIEWVDFLDYFAYDKKEATDILSQKIGWRPYEKKHYESVFTRFYQGHILPEKFNIDKRKLHYSTLICSGQMSRDEALELMKEKPYSSLSLLGEDKDYVLKKLGFSLEDFEQYLNSAPVLHTYYPSDTRFYNLLLFLKKFVFSAKNL